MHVQNNAEKPVNPADAGVALQPKPAENREPAPKRDEAPAIPGAATDLLLGRGVRFEGKLTFDDWVQGIKNGRCYVSDGLSHLMDFSVNGLGVGLKQSKVKLAAPGQVSVKATVAAWLEPQPTPETEKIRSSAPAT